MLASALGVLFKGRNLARLLGGLWVTLRLSAVSILLSVALGLALGMVMTLRSPIIRALTRLWLETIRIVPQLVLLFIVYFGLARAFNLHCPARRPQWWYLCSGAQGRWAIWCAAR